jgi:2-polyprenyl-3-methyl-5-hydroxy-6-metoxy-1,4-benzoquinol methylase
MILEERAVEITEQEEILWALEENAPRYNDWLLSRALPHCGTQMLEVGAGIGTFTLPLAEHGIRITALEPDERLADVLEERTRHLTDIDVYRESIEPLTPDRIGRTFDSVICFNVLEHIADDKEALITMRRCLRKGGELMVLVPAHQFLFGETDRAVHHERRYDARRLSQLLSAVGLEIIQLQYVNPLGAAGWLVSSRILRRQTLGSHALKIYEHLVPTIRHLDRLPLPLGLSLWARARRGHA